MSFQSVFSVVGPGTLLVLLAMVIGQPLQAAGEPAGKVGQWIVAKNHPEKAGPSTIPEIDDSFGSELDTLIASQGKTRPKTTSSGYRLKDFPSEHVVVYEDPTDYHPSLILNQKPRFDLILEVPHAGLETGTVAQAAFLMQKLGARAILMSGMHRCAASTYSDCDGKTSVCGESEGYRTSDAAHSVDGVFQDIHQRLTRAWPKSLVIQLHGMRPSDQGPMVILSSTAKGLKGDDGPVGDLRASLRKQFKDKVLVFSCHNPEDLKQGFRLLCGFTNVQGREINGSTDPCDDNATSSAERFIHVEQDYEINTESWYLDGFAAALESVLKAKHRI